MKGESAILELTDESVIERLSGCTNLPTPPRIAAQIIKLGTRFECGHWRYCQGGQSGSGAHSQALETGQHALLFAITQNR